ncbi:jg3526 [Pararge aegeria aegeria]|uniref:Jg3526 protein n=1 Tax=Pararge aegeria aegeria TaxID=348720 RepID=A0A8S4QEM0_9NEOP|nr:jg3526 [Pararge aegeria aegeria]
MWCVVQVRRYAIANNLIINEFLTFVQNKADVLDELSIVQICVSNFTTEEIESGKNLLFENTGEITRNIQRKGEDKNKKNVKDVIKRLKETDPKLQPIFVAKDINRLLPASFEHVDVTRLLKDLTAMKCELHIIRNESVSKMEMTLFEARISTEISHALTSIKKPDPMSSPKARLLNILLLLKKPPPPP